MAENYACARFIEDTVMVTTKPDGTLKRQKKIVHENRFIKKGPLLICGGFIKI